MRNWKMKLIPKMSEMNKLCGKSWRPSNGTEGEIFIDDFCAQCIHEKFWHTQDHADKQCEIFNRNLLEDMGVEIPELIYDERGMPTCTSFVKWDWDKDDDGNWNDPPPPMPYDPNQLVIPFEFEELENQTYKTRTKEITTA